MKTFSKLILLALFIQACTIAAPVATKPSSSGIANKTASMQKKDGFFNYYWDDQTGKVFLEVPEFDQEFLYVNYLAAGVGSNDLGLDRGQIGDSRVVYFKRVGPKVLMIQPNYDYRALSENANEVRSVNEAFAQSILWGFKVEAEEQGSVLIDITDFILSDAHKISQRLKSSKEGSYSVDASRSAVYLPMTKNFKDNTEFEATIAFKGEPTGRQLRTVTPTAEAFAVRMHHSFVRLPDDKYQPRKNDPRSGYYSVSYQDYATPIDESLVKHFIRRHRLEKKDPSATISEPVKPIIYYVDKGAPEPVKSALIEGASWWNEAFEAAGFRNAFQVYVLPDSADPLDINYNVIQWVHRSTRGWSYGSTVTDPRTGEILKGHVSLGSLRIRQDFLIATGLLQPYDGESENPEMLEMALARLRQLSAHEVGHTLGLYHNFAASTNDKASVMDYPHPQIDLDSDGQINIKNAYAVGIGNWDKYTIRYGYGVYPENETESLNAIIDEWIEEGYQFITDSDARATGGAHPAAHLWDNGSNPAEELERISTVRNVVLNRFSENAIKSGEPISSVEEVLVPMYFLHRYQIEAAVKLIGGVDYAYKVKGDGLSYPKMVSAKNQLSAISSLTETLKYEFLQIPEPMLQILSPKVPGYGRTRESFRSNSGLTFDPIAAAETSADMTLSLMFHPNRIERVIQQNLTDPNLPSFSTITNQIFKATWKANYPSGLSKGIKTAVEMRALYQLMALVVSDDITVNSQAAARMSLNELIQWIRNAQKQVNDPFVKAHYQNALAIFDQFQEEPAEFKIPGTLNPPDGSPIGSNQRSEWSSCAMD